MLALVVILLFMVGLGIFLVWEYVKDLEQRQEKAKDAEQNFSQPGIKEPASEPRPMLTVEFTGRNSYTPKESHPLHSEDYLTADQEKQSIKLDSEGIPNISFKEIKHRLVPTVQEGIINPRSRGLYKYGIYIFNVRGVGYHKKEVARADRSLWSRAKLVREPENEFDPNAIAIYDANKTGPLGYVNKLNAKRIAPRLDAGEELIAIFTRSGEEDDDLDSLTTQVAVMSKSIAEKIIR